MINMYIAGPMRGYPDFNKPAFDRLAEHLRGAGNAVANPAEFDLWDDDNPLSAINFDLSIVINWADTVVLLPGWKDSRGAVAEAAVALWAGKRLEEARPDLFGGYTFYSLYSLSGVS